MYFLLLKGLWWELLVVCLRISSIFYGFRDKLNRKRTKSANFLISKVFIFHPILMSFFFCEVFILMGYWWGSKISHIWKVYRIFIFLSSFDMFFAVEWIVLSVWWYVDRFLFCGFWDKLDRKSLKNGNFENLQISSISSHFKLKIYFNGCIVVEFSTTCTINGHHH